MEYSVIVLIQQ